MIKQAEGKNKEKEELERLRNDLYLEQHEAEHRRLEEIKTRKRMEDKEEMANAYKYQMKCTEEATRQQVIEEERQRLLREHATVLKNFLPKYTLETKDDYQLVHGGYPA